MPELPEVETTRRGIEPHLLKHAVTGVRIRQPKMRWPIPLEIADILPGQTVRSVSRRGKYLLIAFEPGTLLLHLGMSGSLRITPSDTALRKHDHFILQLDSGQELRLHDPRRFGAVLWTNGDPLEHELISKLGPEPLTSCFTAEYLYKSCQNRKCTIKQHIMNSHVVVGVGNIYASECLFLSGISPKRAAGNISRVRIERLHDAIQQVLKSAIRQGGTTLRDFVREDGQPGYFKQSLNVYDRAGKPCPYCQKDIRSIVLGQRSTFYCANCQR